VLAGYIKSRGHIELVEIEEPATGADAALDTVVFQPEFACLCGSDLPYFDGDDDQYPRQVGHSLHEMIGTVVESSASRYCEGVRVLAVPVDQQGLYERYRVSADRLVPLDARPRPEHALLAQPLGTVIYALKKVPQILDKDVVVVGQGPIGQLFCAALRNLGARHVIAVDRLATRLRTSPAMGATEIVCNAADDPLEAVARITEGHMADLVIEAVGHRDQALNLCVDLCRQAGSILYFGVPPEQIDDVHWLRLFRKNLTVYTSVDPDFRRDFPLAMRWIAEGRVDVSHIITHRFPLAKIQQAYETFRDRTDGALKVLVEFPAAGI